MATQPVGKIYPGLTVLCLIALITLIDSREKHTVCPDRQLSATPFKLLIPEALLTAFSNLNVLQDSEGEKGVEFID